jgi:hypothetical protein
MTASPDSTAVPSTAVAPGNSAGFARAAKAILATMLLLIVALTGILVETTWHDPAGEVEVLPPDPGSFAQR